jgi:hypothetical protein
MKKQHEVSLLLKLQKEIESSFQSRLEVPEKLINPHTLIMIARESLERKDRYENNGLVSCRTGELSIRVSKNNTLRALRVMDTLIKLLKLRNHRVLISHTDTIVNIKNQEIKISLREKIKRIPSTRKYYDYDYLPTELLIFKIDELFYTKEWSDGKLLLEDQLANIIARLELIEEEMTKRDIEIEKSHNERRQKEIEEKELLKRQENDLNNFKDMLQKASRWHEVNNLRNYISEVEIRAIVNNKNSEELKTWLEWARKKTDWYDPFIEEEDVNLSGVDKNTLTLKNNK